MLDDLAAHRAHQQPGKPAAAAGADDYQVGILRSIDQFLDHKAVHSVDLHRGGPGIAQPAGYLVRHLLSGLAQFFQEGRVRRADHRNAAPVALRDLMHCDDSKRGVHSRCLSHRPVKGAF